MTAMQLGQDFNGAVGLIGHTVSYKKTDSSEGGGIVTGVKPDPSGALVTVGSDQVYSGDIDSVS